MKQAQSEINKQLKSFYSLFLDIILENPLKLIKNISQLEVWNKSDDVDDFNVLPSSYRIYTDNSAISICGEMMIKLFTLLENIELNYLTDTSFNYLYNDLWKDLQGLLGSPKPYVPNVKHVIYT